uniref:Uncharacterized protein n=1 Tax=Tetranychus urticae TaxID=32264 RepID=T1KVM1_TETUR
MCLAVSFTVIVVEIKFNIELALDLHWIFTIYNSPR